MKYFILFFLISSLFSQSPLKIITNNQSISDKKVPVIFLMHGYGDNERYFNKFIRNFDEDALIVSMRAPFKFSLISLGFLHNKWFHVDIDWNGNLKEKKSQILRSEKLIIDTITHIQDEYNIDTTKIFIGGFSQGGMMALHMLSKYTEKFKGFIAHSTRFLKNFEFQDNLSRYKNLNLLIIHGKRDLVLRIRNAYETKKKFDGMNANIEFHELKIGHRITIDSINIIEDWFSRISS